MRPLLPPHIAELRPYIPGRPPFDGEGRPRPIQLASNENFLGPSPRAMQAAIAALQQVRRYPDDSGFSLRSELASRHGVALDQVIIGGGCTALIELVSRTFLGPGDEAVISENAFIMYRLAVQGMNGKVRSIQMNNDVQDLGRTLAALTPETRILFIANPNNPTGTFVPRQALFSFLQEAPPDLLVVIDHAYYDFADSTEYTCDRDAMIALHPRLLSLYTFSKSHALAGLRIGYGIAPAEIIDGMNRTRTPFGATAAAQAAALAALDDEAHLRRVIQGTHAGIEQLREGLQALGLSALPTAANFLMLRCPMPGQQLYQALKARGVLVRPLGGWGLPDSIRVTVGSPEENATFLRHLEEVIDPVRVP